MSEKEKIQLESQARKLMQNDALGLLKLATLAERGYDVDGLRHAVRRYSALPPRRRQFILRLTDELLVIRPVDQPASENR